jgi:hypothetical protein
MTKTQKFIVVFSAITVSVVVGGLLYLYFNRNAILKKMREGESVIFTSDKPILEKYETKEYSLKYDPESKNKKLDVSLKDENIGHYAIESGKVYFSSTDGDKKEVTHKDEIKLLKFLLNKL